MKRLTWLSISLLSLVLVACEDMMEIEKQSYVIAIGVDQTDQEGKYQFTFQISNPDVGAGSEGTSRKLGHETITIPSSDLITAVDIANDFVTKRINLDHTRVLLISEDLAKSGDFIRIVQPSSRTTQMRRSIQLIVTKENAETFLRNANPKLEQKPHKYFQYMITRANETGVIPDADFHRFFQITEGGTDLFLAIYATTIQSEENLNKPSIEKIAGEIIQSGGNPAQFIGSAVFKNGKMIDVLNGQDTRITNVLDKTKDMENVLSAFPDPVDPRYNISGYVIQKVDPSIDFQYDHEKEHASINVFIPLDFEIVAIPSMIHYSGDNELINALTKSFEDHYQSITTELIKKTQQEYQADPFYWSILIRKFFKDIPSYEAVNWCDKVYPNADITVRVELERLEFGKSLYDTDMNRESD